VSNPGQYDYEDDDRSRYVQPHRGTLILVLGILSFVLGCFPLGIAAWIMGSADLKAMQAGEMDRAGEGMTRAGQVLGIICTLLVVLGICFAFVVLALLGGAMQIK
jgi:hypothetical protein